MSRSYITLSKEGSGTYVEKRSEFIGYAKPVSTEQECIDYIEKIKGMNKGARHNVYAYIVNEDGQVVSRYSDDGEPQGTGGIPVLDVLRKQDITNAVIVVTRYFGGVLLGAAGLVRAYGKAASLAIADAGLCRMVLCQPVSVTVEYTFYGKLQNALADKMAQAPVFGENVTVTYIVEEDEVDKVVNIVNEVTNGKNYLSLGEKEYYPVT
ncbi:MAG: IMPACT family protein [Clostridia bacterium]|jgi:uncharacterized YigZ family protein